MNHSEKQSENQEEEEEERIDQNMKTYNKYKWLLFFTRKYKMNDLVPPLDIKEAFSKIADGGSRIAADQLRLFLSEHQGHVDCTLSESEQIVEKVLKVRRGNHETTDDDQNEEQHGLTLEDLFYFLLFDDYNSPLKAEVCSLDCLFGFLENSRKRIFIPFFFPRKCHLAILSANELTNKKCYFRFIMIWMLRYHTISSIQGIIRI